MWNASSKYFGPSKSVRRVADPSDGLLYERPDDMSDYGWTWREALLRYNQDLSHNPLRLLPAWQLYDNPVYGRLFEKFGVEKFFILSAGWGLIRADFLTPYYDITFSPSADAYKCRRKTDRYEDFCMLPANINEDVLFFGGKDYLPSHRRSPFILAPPGSLDGPPF